MKKLFVLLLLPLFMGCFHEHYQYNIKIEAGNMDRSAGPVYVDVLLPAVESNTPACIMDGKVKIPGQLENLGGGMARIWWTCPAMNAGQIKEYTIFFPYKCAKPGYQWAMEADTAATLTFNNIPVIKYLYAPFNQQNFVNTQKPYHHVYAPDGGEIITKGDSGGLYPHHRGIFFGYTTVTVGDSLYNSWYCNGGEYTAHNSFVTQMTGAVYGGHVVSIDWMNRQGEPYALETRTVRAFKLPDSSILIDYAINLDSFGDSVLLSGDRQHGGVHFRAAQYVADHDSATRFIRHEQWSAVPADSEYNADDFRNVPWDAMQFSIDGHDYIVVYMSDPVNPKPADFSERKYGRFGEFFPYMLTPEQPLAAHYRFWILNGHDINREQIEKQYQALVNPIKISIYKYD
ncbi:MAG TPA: PmoA family protein [bacterium]|nr:PmoA family protein [bacterium]HPN42873.1 PmoA family protein [bacterium]